MTIVYLGICWLLGIWFAQTIEAQPASWLLAACGGLIGLLLRRRDVHLRRLMMCATALALGGARQTLSVARIDQSHIAFHNDGEAVWLNGVVVEEPDIRDRYVDLRVEVENLETETAGPQAITGKVLVRAPRFPIVPYGARVQLEGRLVTPPNLAEFDYRSYLARQGVHSMMVFPQITVTAENAGSPLKQALFNLKTEAQAAISRLIPDPQAALLRGILLGDDNGISRDLAEDFQRTGLTHIIAISGFNITILVAFLMRLGEPFLNRWGTVIFALMGVVLYTVLVGADASVVRAAIMGGVYVFTRQTLGRQSYWFGSLLLAAFVMTLFNPAVLWDVGFQLSFAATAGLMLYAEPLTEWTRQRLLHWWSGETVNRIMRLLSDAVLVTVAAQILTLPLAAAYFGRLSLVSLLANALVLPAQPGVMIWGGLATMTGLFVPAVGRLFAWVAWLFLAYTIGLVRAFATLPLATVAVNIDVTGLLLIYAVIGLVTWLAKAGHETRARLAERIRPHLTRSVAGSAIGVVLILFIAWFVSQPDGKLHVIFIDVGQGDATFIETPTGRQILVDGGLYPTMLNEELGRQMPFWDRQIDIVIATHADADHVSGLPGVFERYQVDRLITNGTGAGESTVYDDVLAAAEADGSDIHRAEVGETFTVGDGVQIEFLHPAEHMPGDNRNEESVCLRLVYEDFSLLLTGDAEESAERQMVDSGQPLSAVVFKAGHHGSRSSSNDFFLEAVRPQFVVVSAGKDNRFGHPHPEVLARAAAVGATVLRTDELGTIEMASDGQTIEWLSRP